MKIGVLTIAYNEERFIKRCVRQFKGVADRHLVLISAIPWHGEALPLDQTETLAVDAGAEVVVGEWENEASQRNLGVQLLSDCDWILVVDADEYYEKDALAGLLTFLETAPEDAYGIGKLYTYWKTPEYRIDPPESGGLIVAIRPWVEFTDKRCIDAPWAFLPDSIVMHHHSYVRTDEEMKKKITTFEHQHEIMPSWYENVWLGWIPEMENIHPVNPESFKRAVKL